MAQGRLLPSVREILAMAVTFALTVFAWIFFRAENIGHAFSYIGEIFSRSLFTFPHFPGITKSFPLLVLITLFMITEWIGRESQFALQPVAKLRFPALRLAIYYVIIMVIIIYGNFNENQFIYFQF